jgi:DNA-binding transcriptional LysR family regulator
MDIRLIHYFMSVYEERSFVKAAERMHVVPSALSMQILQSRRRTGHFRIRPDKKGR